MFQCRHVGPSSQAMQVLSEVSQLPLARFVNRAEVKNIQPSNETHTYYSAGDRALPKKLREWLYDIAPPIEGMQPAEVIVNRYPVGGGIGKHADRQGFFLNMVVALTNSDDVLRCYTPNGTQDIADKAGQATLISDPRLSHEVPPVKNERHTIIYLYQ